jgi:GNAT superfamily N-acetyltransferase
MLASSPNIHFRPAASADAEAATALACRAKASWGYPPEWLALWREALTITPEYLAMHQGLVAVRGNDLVGICVLESRGEEASLEHVWIAPDHQGRGIGRTLVERALEVARDAGIAKVRVESDPFAEPFYLHLGAQRVGAVAAPAPGAPERILPLLEFTLPSEDQR